MLTKEIGWHEVVISEKSKCLIDNSFISMGGQSSQMEY